jgi:Methyltransferase small domain
MQCFSAFLLTPTRRNVPHLLFAMWPDIAQWSLLCGVVLIAGSVLWSAIRLGIGPMPSSKATRDAILSLIERDCAGIIVELGAGWGGLALALAKHCPGASVVAIEASLFPALFCRLRFALSGQPNVAFKRADFYTVDLSRAETVVCYLFRGAMEKLEPKFSRELQAGARVISHTFSMYHRPYHKVVRASDLYASKIYLYTF